MPNRSQEPSLRNPIGLPHPLPDEFDVYSDEGQAQIKNQYFHILDLASTLDPHMLSVAQTFYNQWIVRLPHRPELMQQRFQSEFSRIFLNVSTPGRQPDRSSMNRPLAMLIAQNIVNFDAEYHRMPSVPELYSYISRKHGAALDDAYVRLTRPWL